VDALTLMSSFAERTGLTSSRPSQRYLWTDAFAVENFLGLGQAELARKLIAEVHRVLGHHRPDDVRTGWISGMTELEGAAHPTRGGLRIGKKLPERLADEPLDDELEWDRDGQYFHYLTKWMNALDQASVNTNDARFNVWARELAKTAHRAFVRGAPGSRRMAWKLSIDLSRPLVSSMGQHDPLDGLITCVQLQSTAALLDAATREPSLDEAVADFRAMIEHRDFVTSDPLGIGGVLMNAARVAQLEQRPPLDASLLSDLLDAALAGLTRYVRQPDLRLPATHRLAFRELGLAIGLRALERAPHSEALNAYVPLAEAIESFWCDRHNREAQSFTEHRDINEVMLATSLARAQ